ncbi:MAG: hypothetical protein FWD03_05145 [Defluviitaleaceae bacterium]|nr:hypothetical protein [Defluviitaleaceae bacterium]
MEFQTINDISSFWGTLVPPIFLGTISILLFLWVAGKENREALMKRFIDKNTKQYVLQNGIYITKNQTTRNIFIHCIGKKLGFESIKPLMIVFLVILFFFGINQILLQVFPPLLTHSPSRLLFSSGVSDHMIASIWMHYPHAQSLEHLYFIIMDLTEDTRHTSSMFQFSVQAFIKFNIICCLAMLFCMAIRFKKPKWINMKVYIRLIALTFMLVVALAVSLFYNIQTVNNEVRSRSNEAFFILEKRHDFITDLRWDIQNIKIENYITIIEEERAFLEKKLFYGAFGIRIGLEEAITNAIREFYRSFTN